MNQVPYLSQRESYATTGTLEKQPDWVPPAVQWKRKRKETVAYLFVVMLLMAWLAGAFVCYKKQLVLPINYFEHKYVLVSMSNYNALIQFAASLASAAIAYGVGLGFKALLRRKLTSNKGISLYTYGSAFVALVLFAIHTPFNAATAAGFGASIDLHQISAVTRVTRLSENLLYLNLTTAQSTPDLFVGFPGDVDSYLDQASAELFNSSGGPVPVLFAWESPETPLFDPSALWNMMFYFNASGPSSEAWNPPFSARDVQLLNATSSVIAKSMVEVFSADTTCAAASTGVRSSQLSSQGGLSVFNIQFPCGNSTVAYSASPDTVGFVADTYACEEGTPTIYFYRLDTQSGQLLEVVSCSVNASSSLAPVQVVLNPETAQVTGPVEGTMPIPTGYQVVSLIGVNLINHAHGQIGWPKLDSTWTSYILQQGSAPSRFFESFCSLLVEGTLVRLSAIVHQQLEGIVGSPVAYHNHTATVLALFALPIAIAGEHCALTRAPQFDLTAIQMHLTGPQVAYVVPVALLLVLLLLLGINLFLMSHTGSADFTNPVTTTLIGINSNPSLHVVGSSTGSFGDRWRIFGSCQVDPRTVRIAITEKTDVPGQPQQLQFVALRNCDDRFHPFSPPKEGQHYL